MQAVAHRVPQWHPDTGRWRLRIGFYFNGQDKRVEKTFWWPGQRGDGTPPPAIIAAAVAAQDRWRKIKSDWPEIADRLRAMQPDRDWSKPVWYDPAVIEKYDAAEKAMSDAAVQQRLTSGSAKRQRRPRRRHDGSPATASQR